MKRRLKTRQLEEIPVGSFSDIAFLLIIFFILVTTLTKSKGFETELPSGEPTQSAEPEKNPSVAVSGSDIRLDEQVVTLAQLKEKLMRLKLGDMELPSQKIVILEASGGVAYQQYFEVMATISQASGIVAIVKEDVTKK